MDHFHIYHETIPDFLRECMETPVVKRLERIGMNCGCEYTSFQRFADLAPYSRYAHSVGVALIVWRFTHDRAQAVAGLLHDVASPVFAHVVDFMLGDYLTQESTEDGTAALIEDSTELQAVLKRYGLETEDVRDYHRYPVADNDSPRLSADRLEYTLGNCVNFGICPLEEVRSFYDDLAVGKNEEGVDELMFAHPETAEAFAHAALACSRIYVSDEDRYAMQILAEVLRRAVERGVIGENDLYATEPEVIGRLCADPETAELWRDFRAMNRITRAPQPGTSGRWRRIAAKKRCIDPMVRGAGRVSRLSPAFAEALARFLDNDFDDWVMGDHVSD